MKKIYKSLLATAFVTASLNIAFADDKSSSSSSSSGTYTQDANMNVLANVNSACGLTASTLNFGTYTSNQGLDLDQLGQLVLFCTKDTPYAIGVDVGLNTNTATDYATRYMRQGESDQYLMYSLYLDEKRTKVWNDQFTTDGVLKGTFASVNEQKLPIYGRVFKGQNVASGPYQDTVKVTLQYS